MFRVAHTSRVRAAILSSMLSGALLLGPAVFSTSAHACGGFFCELTPIDQAGEQIIFRHQGTEMTALVRILYSGDAESFSWVVPVPNEPVVSLGDDAAFVDLDLATRPQFELERRGESCPGPDFSQGAGGGAPQAESESSDSGVDILQEFTLGGFDVQIIQSNDGNPEAMATWLIDNGYTLSDRGRELLQPYVDGGMVFVALKLRSGASTGSIQPLVMKYQTEKPMIPIRLTAVAAQADMGIQTWIVADQRAVPENYLHVKPNYTRLNWYAGQQNAYASYQSLITAAMNEVSAGGENQAGQGFATDFAGPISSDILSGLANSTDREANLTIQLAQLDEEVGNSPADFIANAFNLDNNPIRLLPVQTAMPLPEGSNADIYQDATRMRENFTAEQLQTGKDDLRNAIVNNELEPLRTTLGLLPEGAYMTRLYTTLSADEMGVDPVFAYNSVMPDQPLTRKATLDQSCIDDATQWTLTLGEGTEREGEVVISANLDVPFVAPAGASMVDAAFIQERTSGDAGPQQIARAIPGTLELAADGSVSQGAVVMAEADEDDEGFLGLGFNGPLMLGGLGLLLAFRRRRAH